MSELPQTKVQQDKTVDGRAPIVQWEWNSVEETFPTLQLLLLQFILSLLYFFFCLVGSRFRGSQRKGLNKHGVSFDLFRQKKVTLNNRGMSLRFRLMLSREKDCEVAFHSPARNAEIFPGRQSRSSNGFGLKFQKGLPRIAIKSLLRNSHARRIILPFLGRSKGINNSLASSHDSAPSLAQSRAFLRGSESSRARSVNLGKPRGLR